MQEPAEVEAETEVETEAETEVGTDVAVETVEPEAPAEPGDPTPDTDEVLRPAESVSEGVEKVTDATNDLIGALPEIAIALLIFSAFVAAGWLAKRTIRWLANRRRENWGLGIAVGRLAQGVLIVVGLLVAAVFVFPSFTPADLFGVLGLGSVAVGFAFRDVLQNYLAGILLLVTEPFSIGDQIIFKGYEGQVEDIQTRATFLRTYDGRRVVIPNGELFVNSVTVNTVREIRRIEYDVGIGYDDAIDEAKAIMLRIMRDDETAIDDPAPQVLVVELGGEAVKLRARWWIDPPQKADLFVSQDRMLQQFKEQLMAADIELPFPTTEIVIRDKAGNDAPFQKPPESSQPAANGG